MLPPPTAENVLIVALVAAHTAAMSTKKCSEFRWATRNALGSEHPRVRSLSEAIPTFEQARDRAFVLLRTGCLVCTRRESCKRPVE